MAGLLDFLGPVGAVLGGVGSLIGANSANKAANAQKNFAKKQLALYDQTSPYYTQTLQALAGNAGLGQHQVPGQPNIYGNVSNDQLGVYNNPADRLRLLGAEEDINKGLLSRQNQLSAGLGRRGLTGSNYDVAGRAALLSQANQQRGQFGRNLAINAGQEQERRLQLLLNALNPGLGAGPAASNTYGQLGANAANTAAGINQGLGGAAQQYALLQGLQNQGGGTGLNNLMTNGTPQSQFSAPGLGYGNPEAFTPNPSYGSFPGYGTPQAGVGLPPAPGQSTYNPWDEFGK